MYPIFLMIELARAVKLIPKKLEYDLTWERGEELYKEFKNSTYDNKQLPLYECILSFVETKKRVGADKYQWGKNKYRK